MPTGPGSTVDGVYKYGEDDNETLFSDLLNKLGDSLRGGAWINVGSAGGGTFGTNVSSSAAAGYSALALRKHGTNVRINGIVTISTSWSSGAVMFTLPVGMRPARKQTIEVLTGATTGVIAVLEVASTGVVTTAFNGTASSFAIDGEILLG